MNDQEDRGAEPTGSRGPKRHRYEPPSVLESAEFETLALQCGKNDPETNIDCLPVEPSAS